MNIIFRSLFPTSDFRDDQGTLGDNTMRLMGKVDRGRFGNSVASLGDVDDDGYEGWRRYLYIYTYVHTRTQPCYMYMSVCTIYKAAQPQGSMKQPTRITDL